MDVKFNGRYAWNGIFSDEEGGEAPFVVFADTFDEAYRNAVEGIPGPILAIVRGDDVSGSPVAGEYIAGLLSRKAKAN